MIAILGGESIYLLLFIAGITLLVGEALAPGAHFFVLGIALFTAGLVGMILPGSLGILGPIILALAVVVVTAATLWGYRQSGLTSHEGLAETSDSESLRGKFGYVTEAVSETRGEVKIEGGGFNPYFRARSTGGTIEEGTEVMVLDPGGGNVVTVEPVTGDDDIDRELARERESGATDSAIDATESSDSDDHTDDGSTGDETTDEAATDDETTDEAATDDDREEGEGGDGSDHETVAESGAESDQR